MSNFCFLAFCSVSMVYRPLIAHTYVLGISYACYSIIWLSSYELDSFNCIFRSFGVCVWVAVSCIGDIVFFESSVIAIKNTESIYFFLFITLLKRPIFWRADIDLRGPLDATTKNIQYFIHSWIVLILLSNCMQSGIPPEGGRYSVFYVFFCEVLLWWSKVSAVLNSIGKYCEKWKFVRLCPNVPLCLFLFAPIWYIYYNRLHSVVGANNGKSI